MMTALLLLNGPSAISLFFSGLLQMLMIGCLVYKLFSLNWRIRFDLTLNICAMGLLFFSMSFISFLLFQDDSFFYVRCFLIWVLSLIIAQLIVGECGVSFIEKFSNVILVFTILGILGLFVNLLTPGFEFVKSIPPRDYHTNFLTVWITDSGYNSSLSSISPFPIRLQSFFDEPGTYGILLLPAFYYFILEKRFVYAFIISLGVLFSESLNAIILMVVFSVFIVSWRGSLLSKFLLLFFVGAIIFSLYDFLRPVVEIKLGLDPAYETNSSLSVRQAEYERMFSSLDILFSIQPFSIVSGMAISSSYVRWFFFSGIAFFITFLTFIIELVCQWKIVCGSEYAKRKYIPVFLLSLSLFISGFQRSSILDNILFMTLFMVSSLSLRYLIKDGEKGASNATR